MSLITLWWVLVGVLVVLELLTGSFYLLMIALGAVAAAVVAHLGFSLSTQLVVMAVVASGAVAAWHFKRGKTPNVPTQANASVNMDVGAEVTVEQWNNDRSASVKYRGASWTVLAVAGTECVPGLHRVREVSGNRLIVEKI